jgi:hypothetical protein
MINGERWEIYQYISDEKIRRIWSVMRGRNREAILLPRRYSSVESAKRAVRKIINKRINT